MWRRWLLRTGDLRLVDSALLRCIAMAVVNKATSALPLRVRPPATRTLARRRWRRSTARDAGLAHLLAQARSIGASSGGSLQPTARNSRPSSATSSRSRASSGMDSDRKRAR